MKITIINGTEKHGVTYRLKELFLEDFRGAGAEISEFYLPKDCPHFCCGCMNCILKGEKTCKDFTDTAPLKEALERADLLVFTSPAYVYHATGAMKAFLDHFAFLWLPHRPSPAMFSKRAVVIAQCLGAGAASAAKDIRDSLLWWGISEIDVFTGRLMGDVVWDNLPEKRRKKLMKGIKRRSKKFMKVRYDRSARTKTITKIKFSFCRLMQKSLHEKDPEYLDGKYWAEQGWLGKVRPWRDEKKRKDR